MLQNVLSFFTKNLPYFQLALGVWQILKSPLPGVFIQGVMGWLLSLALPGFFPAYEQLRDFRGCLFKTVKCVVLIKGKSQSKTKPPTELPEASKFEEKIPLHATSDPTGSGANFMSVDYLGETFKVNREGNKVFVNEEMSYYISDSRQWEKILQMGEECFKKKAVKGRSKKEEKVVFVKGCQFIWQKVATGKIMEFEEVLDDVIFENNDTVLMSDDVWFLPVDLSEESKGIFRKLLNLVGLFFSIYKKTSLANSFSIASAILEIEPVRSCIYWIMNKMFCRSVQYICNKLPYPVRRFVYWLFNSVENLKPRNDIRLKVVRCDYLNVVIGGSAKINSAQETTHVDWLDQKEKYEFRCGCSIVMKATYNDVTGKCTATVQHTNAVFGTEERLAVKCEREQFKKIGTFLSCLATSKAGSLFKYDRNDNKVHVRGWKESLRHYKKAGFPEIYKLRLHDVIV